MRTLDDVFNRVRAEFLEMPGLRLSPEEVQRLCDVDRAMCQLMLDTLVDAKFLRVTSGGRYARLTEGGTPRSRAAKATLRPASGFAKAV